ncbi:MAG: ATP-binding cassette domain-containing protein [Alphaproteobacteria bacterium]|nr:ATP-binding cassette domain-containing protein [Alphaproteobacteria bacterium]
MNLRDATRSFEERERGNRQIADWNKISLDKVTFSHDTESVLVDTDLMIKRGEFITFFGPSGSGKTTTVDLLIGLLEPDSGDVLVDGTSLFEFNSQSWRSQIGYVPQDCVLFNGSILENIRLGDDAITEDQVREALESANALEFVEGQPQGLHAIVSERGQNLSGGQRQRLSLARALVRQPKILILDEVTSSLDIETEAKICTELQRLHHQTMDTLTVIAISHRPMIAKIADRFFQVIDGNIVESTEVTEQNFTKQEYV